RGVVLPSTASGVAAACFLGLGRALGEAIAVTQVIGAGNAIHSSLFATGDTLASRIANQFQGATTKLQISALFYLGALLLVIGVVVAHGAAALSWHFLPRTPPAFGPGGGIAPAIVGTVVIVALATAIAMPLGVLVAIYLTEFAGPRGGGPIRLVLDVMNGLPS